MRQRVRTLRKLVGLVVAGVLIMAVMAGCGTPASASTPVEAAGAVYPAVPPGTGLVLTWRQSGGELHVVDLKTGEDHPDYAPIKVGMVATTALSPDGKTLAVYVSPDNN